MEWKYQEIKISEGKEDGELTFQAQYPAIFFCCKYLWK
jgi:hypothetical protein